MDSIKHEISALRIAKPEFTPNEVPLPKFLVPNPRKASALDMYEANCFF